MPKKIKSADDTRQLTAEEQKTIASHDKSQIPNDVERIHHNIDEKKMYTSTSEHSDPETDNDSEKGKNEAHDLDKMVNDMTSEEAWLNFKNSYNVNKSHGGSSASLDTKLDVISAQVNEMSTDIDRITNIVPQITGEIEASSELDEDESVVVDDYDEQFEPLDSLDTSTLDAFAEENDEEDEDVVENESDVIEDESEEEDEDESDSSDDEEESDEDESDDEEEDEDFVSVEDLEKMIKVLKKLTTRLDMQEREINSLKKAFAKSATVQAGVRKSMPRPLPMTKQIIGNVSRPPTVTSFTSIRKGGTAEIKAPVIGKSTPQEVFEYCQQQTL